ncbi:MAG: hypothetical protein JW908_17080 [Anaerolineales bacterium]|nr:hypothetical protein [Anaerolineales bacterium]
MSKNTKIILGVVGGIIILCMCVCVGSWAALKIGGTSLAETMAKDDPAEAAEIAHAMLDYTLPPGYQEKIALNFFAIKMVLIYPSNADLNNASQMVIMMAEFPSGLIASEENMRNELQQQMNQKMGNRNWKMELIDEIPRIIRGQEVTLLVFEGVDENGKAMKQIMSTTFEGKSGKIMLWMAGSKAGWDQPAVDRFINSIR